MAQSRDRTAHISAVGSASRAAGRLPTRVGVSARIAGFALPGRRGGRTTPAVAVGRSQYPSAQRARPRVERVRQSERRCARALLVLAALACVAHWRRPGSRRKRGSRRVRGELLHQLVRLQPPRAGRPDRLSPASRASRTTTPSSATSRRTRSRPLSSLRAAGTTCCPDGRHGRRTGPRRCSSTAQPVVPRGATIYYRRLTTAPVRPFPPGCGWSRATRTPFRRRATASPTGTAAVVKDDLLRADVRDAGGDVAANALERDPALPAVRRPPAATSTSPTAGTARPSTAPTTRATWRTRSAAVARRATRSRCRRSRSSTAIRRAQPGGRRSSRPAASTRVTPTSSTPGSQGALGSARRDAA